MKNIEPVILDKYQDKQNYEEIGNGLFKDLINKRYVITLKFELETDEDSQYPLEDILDKYYVNCTSHIVEDGKNMEVEIEDGNDSSYESLETMREIASLVGKRVYNKEDKGYIKLFIE